MRGIIARNLKIYFRDKSAVLFSLLGVLIVIGLYFLFLGDTYTDSLKEFKNPEKFMNGWIMAGLLSITSVTTAMGAFGTMVQDKERKIFKDFYCAPISRGKLTMGYILSSGIVGLIMTMIVFVITVIYLQAAGTVTFTLVLLIKLILLCLLTSMSNTAMVLFIVSLLKTEKSFSSVTGVMAALIGFITGIYIPIGQLPDYVQYAVKCFPTSHSAVLFRQLLMDESMNKSVEGFHGAAKTQALSQLKEILGVTVSFGDNECSALLSVVILGGAFVLFSVLSVITLKKKKI